MTALSNGIGQRPGSDFDEVETGVAETADEALHFLQGREEFWKQIGLGETGRKMLKQQQQQQNKSKRKGNAITL